ncbi:unnamed protein product [Clonostachys byssicola]|uniref:Uncharacterized protein n=1 Tax=Clonostachys byssicola TaxID=160290 RepID=A0A9N9USK0_9HYPO|nr:unnamed protein product [Clonostachys byssicola]
MVVAKQAALTRSSLQSLTPLLGNPRRGADSRALNLANGRGVLGLGLCLQALILLTVEVDREPLSNPKELVVHHPIPVIVERASNHEPGGVVSGTFQRVEGDALTPLEAAQVVEK